MKNQLVFDYILSDSIRFEGGKIPKGEYSLFLPTYNGIYKDKVIDENEEEILKWLMFSHGSKLLLNKLGFTREVFLGFSVKKPIVENNNHSDIDLILCEPDLPEFATGFQCKRVKIDSLNYNTDGEKQDYINKISELRKVVIQASKQCENYGFHRNYLMIISEIFGRNFIKENSAFRRATVETQKQIYEHPQLENLHKSVGIIFIEIVQPTEKSFKKQSNIGICIDKEATRLNQPTNLTNRIKELIKSRM